MHLDFTSCTEDELWRYVASHWAKEGIETILVGGAVVSIYSEGAYRSGDLDLEQALLVAKRQKIDLKSIQKWCEQEGHPEAFLDFADKLSH